MRCNFVQEGFSAKVKFLEMNLWMRKLSHLPHVLLLNVTMRTRGQHQLEPQSNPNGNRLGPVGLAV